MRTRPAPMPPTLLPGWMTQYRTEGRVATYLEISALKVMFMDPAMSMGPRHREADVFGYFRPRAVRADQVLRADGVDGASEPVADRHADPGIVLLVRYVLGGEPRLGAARGCVLDQDRLQVGLRDVADQARRRELVVGLPGRVGAPSADPADLLARDRGAEHGIADEFVRRRVGKDLVLDTEVAEDLHRALVGDVRPRGVRRPPVLGDHDISNAQC